jgi:hypothetical protein
MNFEPHSPPLKFQKGPETDAYQWLRGLQGEVPFEGARQVYPFDEEFYAPPRKTMTVMENGPIKVEGMCPKTGRTLRLKFFRDLGGVILRDGPEGGPRYEVLPAALCLTSDMHHSSLTSVRYEDRSTTVPRVSFQAHDGAVLWKIANGSIEEEDLRRLLVNELERVAGIILSAPPVVDPRATPMLTENTRYAPFSIWPEVDEGAEEVERLQRGLAALLSFHPEMSPTLSYMLSIERLVPGEPWRQHSTKCSIYCTGSSQGVRWGKRIATIERDMEKLSSHPSLQILDNQKYGPPNKRLIEFRYSGDAISAHQKLAAMKVLQDIDPDLLAAAA